jgi:hypothetical protein
MRAFRIELRRSVAVGTALLLITIGLIDLFWLSASTMQGGWAAMSYSRRTVLSLLWPLAVGAGAWQSRREGLAKVSELFVTSPRSQAQRLAPVATALAIAGVIAYVVPLLAGTVQVWRSPADMYFTLEGVIAGAVGALSLIPAIWLGLWLGRAIPSAFTAPVAAMLGVAAMILVDELDARMSGPAFGLLMPALEAPYQRDHVKLPLEVSGQQGLWLAALAITAFAVTTAASRPRKLLALAPVAVAALIVIPTLPDGDTDTVYADDRDAMRPVCTTDLPKVCVLRVHSGLLDEVTGPARKALAAVAFLPDAPKSVAEVGQPAPGGYYQQAPAVEPQPADPEVMPLTVYLGRDGHLEDAQELTTLLLQDSADPSCAAPTSGNDTAGSINHRDYAARNLAWTWLANKAGAPAPELPPDPLLAQGLKTLTELPAAAQRKRIITMRAHAMSCTDADLYADLTGERA